MTSRRSSHRHVMEALRGLRCLDLGACAPVRSAIYPKSKTVATKPLSEQQLDPESLVARIVEELRANPAAQRLLLRTLLTNEFLGMPARLQHIERDIAELKSDVAELKSDVAELKSDVAGLKNDVGHLKDSDLEMKVHRRIRPLLSQHLGLRRARVVQSAVHQPPDDFEAKVQKAADENRITGEQEHRLVATDLILQARSSRDANTVWIAVEVANRIDGADISRSRQSADALAAVFGEQALPVVVGQRIDPADRQRADAAGVRYVTTSA